jgi:hypothetical protein
MTTQEVADKLVELCRTGRWQEAQNTLYHNNCKSIEPEGAPWPLVEGLDAIKKKGDQWAAMVAEIHDNYISDPLVGDNYFVVNSRTEATFKGMGRASLNEISLYEVRDGKIVKEQFFYTPEVPGK